MNQQHTPGPWFTADWKNDFGLDLFTIESRSPETLHPGQTSIWPNGEVHHQVATTEEGGFVREINLANAKLVAAAPELLRVAKKALDREYNPFEPNNQSVFYKELSAVITKAEGNKL